MKNTTSINNAVFPYVDDLAVMTKNENETKKIIESI